MSEVIFGIITGVAVAWAVIATGLLVGEYRWRVRAEEQALGWKATWEECEDRRQAFSLSELRAHRPVAMHTLPEVEPAEYLYDETGLVSERVTGGG